VSLSRPGWVRASSSLDPSSPGCHCQMPIHISSSQTCCRRQPPPPLWGHCFWGESPRGLFRALHFTLTAHAKPYPKRKVKRDPRFNSHLPASTLLYCWAAGLAPGFAHKWQNSSRNAKARAGPLPQSPLRTISVRQSRRAKSDLAVRAHWAIHTIHCLPVEQSCHWPRRGE